VVTPLRINGLAGRFSPGIQVAARVCGRRLPPSGSANALKNSQHPCAGRDQMPGIQMGLGQEPDGHGQHDQPPGHADQPAQQAADLLKQNRDGTDVAARPGKPTLKR
jgi:hypothetical protein